MADSGCELSIFKDTQYFIKVEKHRTVIIIAKENCSIVSTERGIVALPVYDDQKNHCIIQLPALLATDYDIPLLSIASLIHAKHTVIFSSDKSGIFTADFNIPFIRIRNMWYLPLGSCPQSEMVALRTVSQDRDQSLLWHLIGAHSSDNVMYLTSQISVDMPRMFQRDQCHLCNQIHILSQNKQPANTTIRNEPGELVHYKMYFPQDIVISHFVDDATGYNGCFIIRNAMLKLFDVFSMH